MCRGILESSCFEELLLMEWLEGKESEEWHLRFLILEGLDEQALNV